jgi:anti-sigma regulatory factor (Ser/Thr protein kinase)
VDILLEIQHSNQVIDARRAAVKVADEIGFSSFDRTVIAVVVSELARNILIHAGTGEILIKGRDEGITIVARDRGTGISMPAEAFQPGHGLFAVWRGMDQLTIAPRKDGHGTWITATKRLRRDAAQTKGCSAPMTPCRAKQAPRSRFSAA